MGSIQLGIQHAVGGLASKPERDLLMQDFMTVETTNFPSEGSNHTPAHHFSEFKFKNYAPIAFRYFRDLFGIQPDDFLVSIGERAIRLPRESDEGTAVCLGFLRYSRHQIHPPHPSVRRRHARNLMKPLGYPDVDV